jgi:hypothetical protein
VRVAKSPPPYRLAVVAGEVGFAGERKAIDAVDRHVFVIGAASSALMIRAACLSSAARM